MTEAPERNAVYRIRGEADLLLYIGVTNSVRFRWNGHQAVQPWWDELRSLTVEWYDTRAEAEAAEKAAILAEQPKYNVTYLRPGRGRGRPGNSEADPARPELPEVELEPEPDDGILVNHDDIGKMIRNYANAVGKALRDTGGPEGFKLGGQKLYRKGEIRRWIAAVEASQNPRAAAALRKASPPGRKAPRKPRMASRAVADEDALFDRDNVRQLVPGGAA